MKNLFPILSIAFLFSAGRFYGVDEELESEPTLSEEKHLKEMAILEPSFMTQQPVPKEDIDLSPLTVTPRRKSSFLAVCLGLVPGLGHAYLGDYQTASILFGSSGLFISLVSSNLINEDFQYSNFLAMQNTWFYGIYAAYRDVRAYNGEEGYSYKMPTDSFTDLAVAPFQWSVLKKPEVWGGFLGALGLGIGFGYLSEKVESHVRLSSSSSTFPLLAFPVGIGEESFFRGFLQSRLSETFSPWGGILLSSLAFGAMHIPNASLMEPEERWRYYSFGIPLITSAGLYFGWLTYKNRSLKESVALHAWYDFAVFLISYSAAQSAAIRKPSFSISIPF